MVEFSETEQSVYSWWTIPTRESGEKRSTQALQAHLFGRIQYRFPAAVCRILRTSESAFRWRGAFYRTLGLKSIAHNHLHRTRFSVFASIGTLSAVGHEIDLLSDRNVTEFPTGEQIAERIETRHHCHTGQLHAAATHNATQNRFGHRSTGQASHFIQTRWSDQIATETETKSCIFDAGNCENFGSAWNSARHKCVNADWMSASQGQHTRHSRKSDVVFLSVFKREKWLILLYRINRLLTTCSMIQCQAHRLLNGVGHRLAKKFCVERNTNAAIWTWICLWRNSCKTASLTSKSNKLLMAQWRFDWLATTPQSQSTRTTRTSNVVGSRVCDSNWGICWCNACRASKFYASNWKSKQQSYFIM